MSIILNRLDSLQLYFQIANFIYILRLFQILREIHQLMKKQYLLTLILVLCI